MQASAALIAGPTTVMPSEYYPEVFGGETSEACKFGSLDEANEILGLMMRHWNEIASTLFKDEVYVPLRYRTRTAWLMATTGRVVSCAACHAARWLG
jgi:yecA family protein